MERLADFAALCQHFDAYLFVYISRHFQPINLDLFLAGLATFGRVKWATFLGQDSTLIEGWKKEC